MSKVCGVPHSVTGNNDRERVLDATDIVQLVGEHISLKPKGREFICLCPFHDDHKPSMYVVPHKQIYHCFSCGAGGNSIDFVVNYHKLPFVEALKFLADRAGVELTPFKPSQREGQDASPDAPSREELSGASSFACDFFRTIYNHGEHGGAARDAVARRAISDEMVETFAIGAAPGRWDGLLTTARGRGISEKVLEACGLIRHREGDKIYDTFRNRLMFPIHDQLGRVIAFGGRILDPEDNPKYLNSPENPLFDKSSTLYGIHQASRAIQKQRSTIIVEGYTDVIACHQAGITNVVGTLGTSLTPKHASILRRLCDRVVLLFDGDEAGAKAADRALEVFFQQPIDVSIAILPGGQDPADILSRDSGVESFLASIESAQDALEYRFNRFARQLDGLGDASRSRHIEQELAHLVDLGLLSLEPIRKRLVVQRLATLAGVDVETIQASMPGGARRRAQGDEAPALSESFMASVGEQALGCLAAAPELIEWLLDADLALLDPSRFADARTSAIAEAIHSSSAQHPVEHTLEDEEARRLAIDLARRVQRVCDDNVERIEAHLRDCLRTMARELSRVEGENGPDGEKSDKFTGSGVDNAADGANNPSPSTCGQTLQRLSVLQRQHTELGGDLRTLPKPTVTAHRVQAGIGASAQLESEGAGGHADGDGTPSSKEGSASVADHAGSNDRTQADTTGDSNR
ncbi:MAG: DNA primase [Planctomycetota bacterium]|jgi:DNA primase